MENQENVMGCMEEFREIIRKEKGENFLREVNRKIEKLRDDSFMDGYKHAIHVLESGLVEKEHT